MAGKSPGASGLGDGLFSGNGIAAASSLCAIPGTAGGPDHGFTGCSGAIDHPVMAITNPDGFPSNQ